VAAREVRIRLEQLSAKYEAAADDDAATRKYLRESMSAAAAARISQPPRRD
jgi:hypothetical protein